MCEYCGCQALAAIAELTAEHDAVVAMIGEARAAVARAEPERAAAVARRIAAVLGPHTVVEEDGLFPALADDFPDHVDGLRDEHRRIGAVLDEATDATPSDPTWPERLLRALHLLRDHILKEQDGVFPAALAGLRPSDWDRVERVRLRAGSAPIGVG
ncbi:MAG TPA: hemerythrin domain-containing protein [Micromonosporaceae bacterium]|nr:hemerythrin domain-containing protein [Micromonosporaceae bacterium]